MLPLRSIFVVLAFVADRINSFVIANPATRRQTVSLPAANGETPSNVNDLFKSDGWKPIQKDLDELPVFTCASEEGKPLAYTIEMKDETHKVPFFFCDVEDAEEELRKAKENTGLSELGIIPFPLGRAFQMWAQDDAVIVPNKETILQAGAPPGTNPIGQHVPLFACMDIAQSNEDGTGNFLPLFMALEEANAAVAEAIKADGGNPDDFEVVSLSLQRAVELLATVSETPAFRFIAPAKSFRYIQKYLSGD